MLFLYFSCDLFSILNTPRRMPFAGEGYSPHTFPYLPKELLSSSQNKPSLEDWLAIFYNSIEYFQKIASKDTAVENAEEKAELFAQMYKNELDSLNSQPFEQVKEQLNCHRLCQLREACLIRAGFKDIFESIKAQENAAALDLLPGICTELDGLENGRVLWETVLSNICAANIFDLGSSHTASMYHDDSVCFQRSRRALRPRPWIIDNIDQFCHHVLNKPAYNKALLFVDNSGSDVLLGMIPFARELLKHNVCKEVVIAANSKPSINDITYGELEKLLPNICSMDDTLCKFVSSERLRIIASGSGLPVIDLTADYISEEVKQEASTTDLVVLEGMGRSIETNLFAPLTIDSLRIGMVKHKEVAQELGSELMDCVVKFCCSCCSART